MTLRIFSIWLAVVSALFAFSAQACSPATYPDPVMHFLQQDGPGAMVFVGVVTSVKSQGDAKKNISQDIVFRPTRALRGNYNESLPVRGFITTDPLAPCGNFFDFTAREGEEWLIFGHLRDGVVYPDKASSRQIKNGTVPPHVLSLLKQLPGSAWTQLRVLGDPQAIYPPEAIKRGHEGTVYIQVTVAPAGRVTQARVDDLPNGYPELREAALRAARAMTFEPFGTTGHTRGRRAVLPYYFFLPGSTAQVPVHQTAPYTVDAIMAP
ncbi:TonB family protein [Dyella tabacisoli]|nr:TonB family protein [Dyella tabacisoli]